MKVLGVIPARFGSQRLPGKPLLEILGKPMVWWVYQRSCGASKLSDIVVATDDERIVKCCDSHNIPVVLTSDKHQTGANRLHEVSTVVKAEYYIQINGDEPLIDPQIIDSVIPDEVPQDVEFGTNIVTPISDPVLAIDPTNIKVVFDANMNALYMSRTPIPYAYKSIDYTFYKHVGMLGYNKKMLDFYNESTPGRYETIEGIDTLRFIDYGKRLRIIVRENCETLSVDTEKDYLRVKRVMEENLGGYIKSASS